MNDSIPPEAVCALASRVEFARLQIDRADILVQQLPDIAPKRIPAGVRQILSALAEARAALAIIEQEN